MTVATRDQIAAEMSRLSHAIETGVRAQDQTYAAAAFQTLQWALNPEGFAPPSKNVRVLPPPPPKLKLVPCGTEA